MDPDRQRQMIGHLGQAEAPGNLPQGESPAYSQKL
jgi:hypothetical protein